MICKYKNHEVSQDRMRLKDGVSQGLCKDCYNEQRREKRATLAASKSPKFDTEGNRRCSHCDVFHPVEHYQLHKGNPVGWCRGCRTEKEEIRRRAAGAKKAKRSVIENGMKLCNHCNTMKALADFSPSVRGLGCVSAYCKPCAAIRYNDKQKARKATREYRERHRERSLANHRVAMFTYRTNKKVTSDGTVTDEFLKNLYATEVCYLCDQVTVPANRTADHLLPLARGGHHSAANLKMACFGCNSSKADLTPEEFLKRKEARNV